MSEATSVQRPPKEKENLLRGMVSGVALRAAEGEAGQEPSGPIMEGHFAVFNTWAEINSFEGNFLEQFASGSFKKTISENRASMKVLFQHGYDYMIGDKPLGPITDLREDDEGPFYEVPLLDAPYVRQEVQPGLEEGLYGASFRFRVIREEINEEPGVSDHNPHGLPERTVKEAQVMEFGPVTFPAYEGASAGLRSLEASELVAQAALERMEQRDSEGAHNLAARFVTRSETSDDITSRDESKESKEDPTEKTAKPEVRKTEGANDDAPPKDSAEPSAHPDRGRRARTLPPWQQPVKKTPPWRSKKE